MPLVHPAIEVSNKTLELELTDNDRQRVHFYLAEAYFHLNRYDQVHRHMQEVTKGKISHDLIQGSVNLWCRHEQTAE